MEPVIVSFGWGGIVASLIGLAGAVVVASSLYVGLLDLANAVRRNRERKLTAETSAVVELGVQVKYGLFAVAAAIVAGAVVIVAGAYVGRPRSPPPVAP